MKNSEPAFPSHGSMGEVTHEGVDLLSHVALKLFADSVSADERTTQERDPVKVSAWRKSVFAEHSCFAYDAAEVFLAERARRLAASAQEEGR